MLKGFHLFIKVAGGLENVRLNAKHVGKGSALLLRVCAEMKRGNKLLSFQRKARRLQAADPARRSAKW